VDFSTAFPSMLGESVAKFNPLDKSLAEIGPAGIGGEENKWSCGVRASNGSIYCAPWRSNNRRFNQKKSKSIPSKAQ